MAQLNSTVVSGSLRATDTIYGTTGQFQILKVPTSSGGTTYGPGTSGNFIKSNGTSAYWTSLTTGDIPTISITDKTSGTLTVERGGTGATTFLAAKNNLGFYTSVTQLGLTSGSATILSAFNALANNKTLKANAQEFDTSEVPSQYGTVVIDKTVSGARSFILFYGKENASNDYRMFLEATEYNSNTSEAPTGTWVRLTTKVKGNAESTYRTGDVNLTPANIGAKATQTAVSSPTASGTAVAFIDTISQNAQGVITATKKTVQNASTSANGLMSSTDKSKLDGIASGAQVNSITGVKGNAESSYRTGNVNLTPANIGAIPLSGSTSITGNLGINTTGRGLYLTDSTGNQYAAIYDNGTNLWIGSTQTAATTRVHTGAVCINAGWNGSAGNSSIYVCVPTSVTGGGTSYLVAHAGNVGTGDSNGQVKIAGTNVSVKGLGSRAYDSTSYLPLAGGTITGNLTIQTSWASVNFRNSNVGTMTTSNNGLTESSESRLNFYNSDASSWLGSIGQAYQDSGNMYGRIYVRNYKTDGSQVNNWISVYSNKDGTTTYSIGNASNFRNAIGASSGVWPVSLGGTGASTLTSGAALIGNGTSAITTRSITNNTTATAVTASTNLITANTLYYHKGNSNIVTVGTITSGTWNAGSITTNGTIALRSTATTTDVINRSISSGITNQSTWTNSDGTYSYIAYAGVWNYLYFQNRYKRTTVSSSTDTWFPARIWFRQYAATSATGGTRSDYYENYYLPETTNPRTSNASYSILTTKSAVQINQGGTGATTIKGARDALAVAPFYRFTSSSISDIRTTLNAALDASDVLVASFNGSAWSVFSGTGLSHTAMGLIFKSTTANRYYYMCMDFNTKEIYTGYSDATLGDVNYFTPDGKVGVIVSN